jgi:hypothetical protein
LRIPDPDFYPSLFPDLKTARKERGEKKLVVHFFVAKYHKVVNYFIFELVKKKLGPIYKES